MQKMFKSVNVQKIFYETAPFLVKNRTPDVLVQINVPDSFYKPLPKFMLTANSRININQSSKLPSSFKHLNAPSLRPVFPQYTGHLFPVSFNYIYANKSFFFFRIIATAFPFPLTGQTQSDLLLRLCRIAYPELIFSSRFPAH